MKKFRYFILVVTGVAAVMLGGCKDKEKYDESAFQDDLEPLSEDEVEAMDQNGDDEMAVADESDLEQLQDSENAAGAGDTDGSDSSDAEMCIRDRERSFQIWNSFIRNVWLLGSLEWAM